MKLFNFALLSLTSAQEGSGVFDADTLFQGLDQPDDGKVILEHRSLFGNSPFGAFFDALDVADEAVDAVVDDDIDDIEEEYEGELEGFDINSYSNSEAVKKVQEAVMFSKGFQRGQGFGSINSGPSAPGVAQSVANRVEVLMKMIMYLQVDPSFDKFFQYGCYCFPDGERAVLGGYGEARDGADLICKKYQNCQRCINKDHVDGPEWAPYKYKGQIDEVTGKKHLTCLNKEGTCRRNHCECDKRLAEQLSEYEMTWQPEYSLAFGGFDRASNCPAVDKRTNEVNHINTHQCCGNYPERFPYVSESETGQLRKCCVDKTYDPRVLACCQEGILKQHGTCGI